MRADFPQKNRPTTFFGFAGWLGFGVLGRSTTHVLHDLGKPIAGVGESVEVSRSIPVITRKAETVEWERPSEIHRSATDLLIVECAKEWLLKNAEP